MANVNITPQAPTDGIIYSASVPLTTTEADLYGGSTAQSPDPIPIAWGQTIVAVIRLAVTGFITGNSTYIILQTDLGDGTWIDVAWCFWNGSQGSATFVLCGGGLGAMNNAFQQSRQSGSVPQPQQNGSNAVPLGGRVRFVGRTAMIGGSSSLAGTPTAVSATITYKLMNPR